jgi:excisionase family DNA binding protein
MKESPLPPVVYTRDEAARLAKIGLSTLDAFIRLEEFPSTRRGRRVLIPSESFDRWLRGESKK